MKQTVEDHALEFLNETEARELEDKLWWVLGRKHIIRSYLKMASEVTQIRKIMDIGCGSGGNFDVLSEFGTVVGIDKSPVLVKRAITRGIAENVFEEDVFRLCDLEDIDLFTLFDVLEHIEDDSAFLNNMSRLSYQHSMTLISVPACPFLFSEHDRILHHYRRYSQARLEDILQRNGYEIIKINYFLFFLFPIVIFARYKEKIAAFLGFQQTNVELGAVPAWLNRILIKILHIEAILSNYFSFPFGLWLFVLARQKT